MIVKRYTGRTVAEALTKVRTDLGSAALIIETKTVKSPGLLGSTVGYEVVAAAEDDLGPATTASKPSTSATAAHRAMNAAVQAYDRHDEQDGVRPWSPADFTDQAAGLRARSNATFPTPLPSAQGAPNGLEDELGAIRRQLSRLAQGRTTPNSHLGEALATALEDSELPAEHIAELDDALAQVAGRLDPSRREEFCTRFLARSLAQVTPLDWNTCRRLLVVGATGVGKTTTIAKIAGDLVLKKKRSVALLTIDTYRVGATDQLQAYADLLGVPLEVATTPAQLTRLMERFSDKDHVLVDTAGRSPTDTARVHELTGFARGVPGLQVMLCAAATSGRAEFAAVVERFSILPLEHVGITKLDECAAPGRLYGCLRRHRLPVRLATTGQEVPDDITPGVPELFARRVFAAQPVAA